MSAPKLIWIKTPKTGGTSIREALRDANLLDREVRMVIGGRELQRYIEKNREEWNALPKVCVVRNPFEKYVSAWQYLKCTKAKTLEAVFNAPPRADRDGYPVWHHITQSQTSMILDRDGCLPIVHYVPFENLESGFNRILEKFAIPAIQLPRLNQTIHGPASCYFTEDLRVRFAHKYAIDFHEFGYSASLEDSLLCPQVA